MKLTFIIVGTFIEISMDVEPNSTYTKPSSFSYKGSEYEVKLYSQDENSILFHLYPRVKKTMITENAIRAIEDLADELNKLNIRPLPDYTKGCKNFKESDLHKQLNDAIKAEDYELAGKLRDKIKMNKEIKQIIDFAYFENDMEAIIKRLSEQPNQDEPLSEEDQIKVNELLDKIQKSIK